MPSSCVILSHGCKLGWSETVYAPKPPPPQHSMGRNVWFFYYGSEKFDKFQRNQKLICSSTLIESCAVMVGCRALCVGSQQTSHRGKEDAQKPSAAMAPSLNFGLRLLYSFLILGLDCLWVISHGHWSLSFHFWIISNIIWSCTMPFTVKYNFLILLWLLYSSGLEKLPDNFLY